MSATPAPTVAPTPSPTPASTATVFGQLQIGFAPGSAAVEDPAPPFVVTLVIEGVGGGTTETRWITDETGAFTMDLDPGDYHVKAVRIRASSLSADPIELPALEPTFTVPSAGCVFVGLITFVYVRVPPGTMEEQSDLIAAIAPKFGYEPDGVYFWWLASGSLLLPPRERTVTLPALADRDPAAANCTVALATF